MSNGVRDFNIYFYQVFWPMIWPSGNSKLQLYMFLIAVTLIGQSVLNVLVPRQFGLVTDSFMDATHGKDSRALIAFHSARLRS